MLIIDYLTTISNNFYHISYLLSLDMNQLEIEKQLRLLKNILDNIQIIFLTNLIQNPSMLLV